MLLGRSRGTYTGVQALRFVAAVLVVMTHATLYTSERLDDSLQVWHFGEVGVDIFFVISGFVMIVSTRAMAEEPGGWKRYAMRRIIRIVPMYWIATTIKLLTLIVVPSVILHATLDPEKVGLSYLFLPSRNVDGVVQPLLGVGWTLTFEMFFYFVLGLAIFLRANRLLFAGTVLVGCAVGWVFRGDPWPPAAVYLDPIVLYFLAGMIIGRWAVDRSARKCLAGLGFVLALRTVLPAIEAGQLDLQVVVKPALVIGVVLAAVVLDPVFNGRVPRPVVFMGDASYSLYLFHPLVAPIVPTVLSAVGLELVSLSLALCVVAAVAAAALIYQFFEAPMTAWLNRRAPYVHRPLRPAGVTAVAP